MTSTPSPQAGTAHSGSEEAHTPGPWVYGVRPDGSIWLSIGDHKSGPHFQGDLVASEADARLIVAAPELLLALKRSLDWLVSYQGGGTLGPTGPYEQARAAIAKATEPK